MKYKEPGRAPVGVRMSESGNSSKFEVSSMLLISMGMAAGLSLQNRSVKSNCASQNRESADYQRWLTG